MLKECANGELREFRIIVDFGASTAEADFLFGSEIRQYLDEISTRAGKLRSANVQYRDRTQTVPPGLRPRKNRKRNGHTNYLVRRPACRVHCEEQIREVSEY